VQQDPATGMVKISVEHISPVVAQEWVTALLKEINLDMKQRDIQEAEKSINYLNSQIRETTLSDIKQALFGLIEDQTKTLMLANVRDEYIFKTIDPAVVAEEKSRPARAIICVIVTILGLLLSITYVLFRAALRKNNLSRKDNHNA
jgi:uncharacterized protein involved in exopolysaccharide biosynthesis